MGDLGFEPRTSGLRVRCATVALVTQASILAQVLTKEYNNDTDAPTALVLRKQTLPYY